MPEQGQAPGMLVLHFNLMDCSRVYIFHQLMNY